MLDHSVSTQEQKLVDLSTELSAQYVTIGG